MFEGPRYLVSFGPKRVPHCFTDVLILGGGLAGLRAALAVDKSLSVTVVTKDDLRASSSHSRGIWQRGVGIMPMKTTKGRDAYGCRGRSTGSTLKPVEPGPGNRSFRRLAATAIARPVASSVITSTNR